MGQVIRVLGVSGSPRRGNSAYLLDQALEAAREAGRGRAESRTFSFRAKKFGPCLGCGECEQRRGECAFQDSFQELRDLWLWADVVVYSVPVYHMSVPGQVKCFLDRLGNSLFFRYADLLPPGVCTLPKQLKAIGAIAQGCHTFSGQEHTLTDLINHALVMQCVPVAGDLWEAYIGAGGWTANEVDVQALARQQEAGSLDAGVAVRAARSVGKRCVEVATLLKEGAAARRAELAKDPLYRPLLDRLEEWLG
jgi:multimeric flavodoxin WrbA